MTSFLTSTGIALITALVVTPLLIAAAFRWGLLDHPNTRSSHDKVTPRGGGLAIVAGVLLVMMWSSHALDAPTVLMCGGALLLAAVGLWDDRFGLSPWARLAAHVAAALLVAWPARGIPQLPLPAPFDVSTGVLAVPLAVVWIVAVVNFYNFLDGIDGLAAAQAVITGLGIALAAWSGSAALLAAAVVGGAAGFLVFNWSPARIFLGDVGSGFVGFLLASLPLLAPAPVRSRAVVLVGTSLWLFLADATWTLLRRFLRGARLHEAHREHLYQHLVQSGLSHRVVTTLVACGSLTLTALAFVGWRSPRPFWAWLALTAAVVLFAFELLAVRKRNGTRSKLTDVVLLLERSVHMQLAGWRRYVVILALDIVGISSAFYLGYLVRFEGKIPPASLAQYWQYLPLLLAIRIPLHWLFGLHRWSFRFSGLQEAMRLVMTSITGTALFIAWFYFRARATEDIAIGSPRSVLLIEFFISTSLMGAIRFSPRLAHAWVVDTMRGRRQERVRTIIVGAGSAGDLLLRDLLRSDEHGYEIVGFVDDDRAKWGTSIGGKPVLGPLSKLAETALRREVEQLLFAIPRLPADKLRDILSSCAELKLKYKILPVSFAYLNDRVAATMLHDLAPDDLLPRNPTQFDQEGLGRQIEGRRIVVTGAGGSIGSEICRQLAHYRPARLVLADINENETYFLYRRLQQEHPKLDVVAEIVDIRDKARLLQMGEHHRPQYVFHAAAHKHVPLMEEAPEEAVKNNVVGSRNVVEMAEAVRAERFVLISTDKAVNPSSVMGATKRIAELIVAERVRAGRTGFCAVRFGNVLGSAGSVVPLFKEQIAAGGPVTVTHPECRRYLMTIPEAVGLVLSAGLGAPGGLCILEMGEPIRILDLARLMITMSGLVPEDDIPIVFTGLRPGERLDEELMTAEEAKASWMAGERIRVVRNTEPPANLAESIVALERLAGRGDRAGVLRGIAELVPNYEPQSVGLRVAT